MLTNKKRRHKVKQKLTIALTKMYCTPLFIPLFSTASDRAHSSIWRNAVFPDEGKVPSGNQRPKEPISDESLPRPGDHGENRPWHRQDHLRLWQGSLRYPGRIHPGNHPLQQEGHEEPWHNKWQYKWQYKFRFVQE